MTKRLGDLATVIMGQAPPGESYNGTGQGIALVAGAGDLGALYPSPKKYTTQASRVSQTGDILVCVRATIGDLNWSDKPYCLGRGVAAVRAKNPAQMEFLFFLLLSQQRQLISMGRGATFQQINKDNLTQLSVPVFEPAEERRLVQRVKECLSRIEEMQRLCQEALAEAELLFDCYIQDRYASLCRKFETRPLHELVKPRGGGTPDRKCPEYWNGSLPWVSPKDMKRWEIDSAQESRTGRFKSQGCRLSNSSPLTRTQPLLGWFVVTCSSRSKTGFDPMFTATVGTIFESSHLPIHKWMMAVFIMCSAKKSVSAHQLHRMLGITY